MTEYDRSEQEDARLLLQMLAARVSGSAEDVSNVEIIGGNLSVSVLADNGNVSIAFEADRCIAECRSTSIGFDDYPRASGEGHSTILELHATACEATYEAIDMFPGYTLGDFFDLTAEHRQAVLDALAEKWGLEVEFTVDHPNAKRPQDPESFAALADPDFE